MSSDTPLDMLVVRDMPYGTIAVADAMQELAAAMPNSVKARYGKWSELGPALTQLPGYNRQLGSRTEPACECPAALGGCSASCKRSETGSAADFGQFLSRPFFR